MRCAVRVKHHSSFEFDFLSGTDGMGGNSRMTEWRLYWGVQVMMPSRHPAKLGVVMYDTILYCYVAAFIQVYNL